MMTAERNLRDRARIAHGGVRLFARLAIALLKKKINVSVHEYKTQKWEDNFEYKEDSRKAMAVELRISFSGELTQMTELFEGKYLDGVEE